MQFSPCLSCGSRVEFDPEFVVGVFPDHGVYCQSCIEQLSAHKTEIARNAALRNRWLQICPPLYRDTLLEALPFPDKSEAVLHCDLSSGIGLNIWGFPDTGKTRTLYLVLERLHWGGNRILAFSPGTFSAELEKRAYHRNAWVKGLSGADILAFDDVDKLSLTRDQELSFFALLDRRMAHRRPCLFTHNSTAGQLEYKFRNGKAMVRRIRQFTQSFHFPQRNL